MLNMILCARSNTHKNNDSRNLTRKFYISKNIQSNVTNIPKMILKSIPEQTTVKSKRQRSIEARMKYKEEKKELVAKFKQKLQEIEKKEALQAFPKDFHSKDNEIHQNYTNADVNSKLLTVIDDNFLDQIIAEVDSEKVKASTSSQTNEMRNNISFLNFLTSNATGTENALNPITSICNNVFCDINAKKKMNEEIDRVSCGKDTLDQDIGSVCSNKDKFQESEMALHDKRHAILKGLLTEGEYLSDEIAYNRIGSTSRMNYKSRSKVPVEKSSILKALLTEGKFLSYNISYDILKSKSTNSSNSGEKINNEKDAILKSLLTKGKYTSNNTNYELKKILNKDTIIKNKRLFINRNNRQQSQIQKAKSKLSTPIILITQPFHDNSFAIEFQTSTSNTNLVQNTSGSLHNNFKPFTDTKVLTTKIVNNIEYNNTYSKKNINRKNNSNKAKTYNTKASQHQLTSSTKIDFIYFKSCATVKEPVITNPDSFASFTDDQIVAINQALQDEV
ncbi:hypothetical protein COBT_000123 [Conglomerata obtusa]